MGTNRVRARITGKAKSHRAGRVDDERRRAGMLQAHGARRTARPARDLPGSDSALAHVLTAATGRGVANTPDDGVAGELGVIFR